MAKLVEEFLSLEATPTWAVATVCFGLISISLVIEYALLLLAKHFNKKQRKSLTQVLDKIKSGDHNSAMIFTNGQKPIAKICIPTSVGESFLPCKTMTSDGVEESKCEEQGKLSLMSRTGMQQLQMLIFVLAFFHVFSSFLTFSLGLAKMKRWESWEAETKTMEYQFSNDPQRFQLINETSFGRQHLKFWSEHRYLRLPVCFLHQFYKSVSKADYLTLRYGFITAHFANESNFDFQEYLRRALEKDFGVLVGISFWIWIFSVTFIFLNAHELLSIGILYMGLGKHPQVHYLYLSHIAIETEDIVIKLGMGLLVHILCGYVTLPLYALVAQMGTSITKAACTEGVVDGLKQWRAKAKKNIVLRNNTNLARPSLDASMASLNNISPSFTNLDASFFVELDNPFTTDGGFVADKVDSEAEIEEDNLVGQRMEQYQKLGSFEGFDICKTS
ncbi:hypothetical protein TEA_020961 [Camellia sinensis var. sinensis]|uniref:MLO-like protein n=1 Tax=Camellia sinensis var. sinensis TaxID=542762 RepID=A0A4S4DAR0_CAMSN|nr:hypothetical protein TEA_020961 [Camellia sinensis var. sinensis]